MKKKGLEEFLEVYDTVGGMGWLALDLAQNLCFRFGDGSNPDVVSEDDVHMAYGLAGGGRKYPYGLMKAIHCLAKALGYTQEDYIDGADKRCGRGNCNIYLAGKGSVNCDILELFDNATHRGIK